jgi:hypothetical protein
MKTFLVLVVAGLGLTLLGFAALFGSLGGALPRQLAFVGFPLIIIGPLTFVGGLVVYALRRPTPEELASQELDNYGTWHFRPAGLLLLGLAMGAFIVAAKWAEQYLPWINAGRPTPSSYVFAILLLLLLSFRKTRDLVFYTGERIDTRESTKAGNAGEPIVTDESRNAEARLDDDGR